MPNTSTTSIPVPSFKPVGFSDDVSLEEQDEVGSHDDEQYGLVASGGLDDDVKFYFSVLIAIGISNSIFTLARAFLFAFGGVRGALRIHKALLSSVLNVFYPQIYLLS